MIKDVTLGQYFPGKSIIHKLDPRVKVLLTLVNIIYSGQFFKFGFDDGIYIGGNAAVRRTVYQIYTKYPRCIVHCTVYLYIELVLRRRNRIGTMGFYTNYNGRYP